MNTSTLPESQIEERPAEPQARASRKPSRALGLIGGLCLVIAIVTAIALGVWSYQLNTSLSATQTQLASLQGDYATLKADNAKIAADLSQSNTSLDQVKADLATATSDLAKAQADLETANGDKAAQRAKLDLAKNLLSISKATVAGDSYTVIDAMVRRTQDTQLIRLWNTLARSPNEENALAFYQYLSEALASALE